MTDFFSQITTENKTQDLKAALLDLIYKVMNDPNTTEEQNSSLARLYSFININL